MKITQDGTLHPGGIFEPHRKVPAHSRGYYLNSLKSWRDDLYKQLRGEMARYNRLAGTFHPDRPDMGRLCDLTKEFIARLNQEIASVSAAIETTPKRARSGE